MPKLKPALEMSTAEWLAHLREYPEDLARLPSQLRDDLLACLQARAAPAEYYPPTAIRRMWMAAAAGHALAARAAVKQGQRPDSTRVETATAIARYFLDRADPTAFDAWTKAPDAPTRGRTRLSN